MPHVVVDVSAHGFGHLAQTACVVNALADRRPDLRFTVRTTSSPERTRARIDPPFRQLVRPVDLGIAMIDAVTVDVPATLSAHRAEHVRWDAAVAVEAAELAALAPDLLLSNVGYLGLAAAAALGVPSIGLCSLHWAAVLAATCGPAPDLPEICARIVGAYAGAAAFVCPRPSMAMPELPDVVHVGPLAGPVRPDREGLRARLAIPADHRVVLISLGGIPTPIPVERWSPIPGVTLVFADAVVDPPLGVAGRRCGFADHRDLLASVDVVVTKPGYGIFVEAATSGVDLVYLPRGAWPEEPGLVDWAGRHGRITALDRAAFDRGELGPALARLEVAPRRPPAVADGAEAAAAVILDHLRA